MLNNNIRFMMLACEAAKWNIENLSENTKEMQYNKIKEEYDEFGRAKISKESYDEVADIFIATAGLGRFDLNDCFRRLDSFLLTFQFMDEDNIIRCIEEKLNIIRERSYTVVGSTYRHIEFKTGDYVYTDGTISQELDKAKELRGVLVVMTDNPEHKLVMDMRDAPERMDFFDAKVYAEEKYKRLATIKELEKVQKQKDVLNKALIAAGGDPLKEDGWYWSSSECSNHGSWLLYMNSGDRYGNAKYSYYYVRVFQLV